MKKYKKQKSLFFGICVLFVIMVSSFLAPWISPHDIHHFDLGKRLVPWMEGHVFGLDEDGRDLFSLVLWGARVSLWISFWTVCLSAMIGTTLGLLAGEKGGWWDRVFIFVSEVVLAFPSILLVIAVAAFYRDGGITSVIAILSGVGWVSYARLVRGQVLTLKERDFVKAARCSGASDLRIWFRYLLPNLSAPLLVNATFGMAGVILAESTLSFLGLGVPEGVPSWGRLLDQGVHYLLVAPHLSFYPGACMGLLILSLNFVGDGLRDRLDVKGVS